GAPVASQRMMVPRRTMTVLTISAGPMPTDLRRAWLVAPWKATATPATTARAERIRFMDMGCLMKKGEEPAIASRCHGWVAGAERLDAPDLHCLAPASFAHVVRIPRRRPLLHLDIELVLVPVSGDGEFERRGLQVAVFRMDRGAARLALLG